MLKNRQKCRIWLFKVNFLLFPFLQTFQNIWNFAPKMAKIAICIFWYWFFARKFSLLASLAMYSCKVRLFEWVLKHCAVESRRLLTWRLLIGQLVHYEKDVKDSRPDEKWNLGHFHICIQILCIFVIFVFIAQLPKSITSSMSRRTPVKTKYVDDFCC